MAAHRFTTIPRKLANHTHDLLFRTVHSRWLIYNACWEDPRIDRELMELDKTSKLVMLTSAGCNALDYLLDAPAEIHCVDLNPRQNALLQLKLALIRRGDFSDLYAMFGDGVHNDYRKLYAAVRPTLPEYAQQFWDNNIAYFDAGGKKRSFYYHGTSGAVAWLLTRNLLSEKKRIRHDLFEMLDAQTLDEQREIYQRIEPGLWGRFTSWVISQPFLLAMTGVPRPQIQLIQQDYPGGVRGYVADKLRHVLTEVIFRDNYFWRVYLTGSYSHACCPNYLKEENFTRLQDAVEQIHVYNTSVTDFLKHHPDDYSHYVLLDHQDWLAWHAPEALAEEWDMILANSRPGSRILMRSASNSVDFLPTDAVNALHFHDERARALHVKDRVGTYGSLHFAEVL